MNYGGGGMSDISVNRIGAVQFSVRVVLCCDVMADISSVLMYTYTTLPKEPVFMPLICVFFVADLYAAAGKESTPHLLHANGKM